MYQKLISSFAMTGFLLLGTAGFSVAQNSTSMHKVRKSVSITGCLTKGDEAGEYSMKTSDGKLYGLTSRNVPLKDHVGHQVKLHGYITPESAEKPEANEQSTGAAEAGGDIDMTVTSLKMLSSTCNQ